ncbi:MAG: hypothetical protein MMC33_005855 [Icmadophila ericetorum]|nr:hypothetical protein [Icmadophila ericetorum]
MARKAISKAIISEEDKPFPCLRCGAGYVHEKDLHAHQKRGDCAERLEAKRKARDRKERKAKEVGEMLAQQPGGCRVRCTFCEKLFIDGPAHMRHVHEQRCLGKRREGDEEGKLEEGEIRVEVEVEKSIETDTKKGKDGKDEITPEIKADTKENKVRRSSKDKDEERAVSEVKKEAETVIKVKRAKENKLVKCSEVDKDHKISRNFKVKKNVHLSAGVEIHNPHTEKSESSSSSSFSSHRKPNDDAGVQASGRYSVLSRML